MPMNKFTYIMYVHFRLGQSVLTVTQTTAMIKWSIVSKKEVTQTMSKLGVSTLFHGLPLEPQLYEYTFTTICQRGIR